MGGLEKLRIGSRAVGGLNMNLLWWLQDLLIYRRVAELQLAFF